MSAPRARAYDLWGVCIAHRDVLALDEVTVSVEAGESVALVGPSGAGKTTMLRVLAGALLPTRGSLRLFDADLPTLRRTGALPTMVGLMPQRLDLVPQLSVKHNVQAGALGRWGLLRSLAALLLPVEDPRARAAAARVGVEDRFLHRAADCSGGEQQRAAFARLLVQDPRVLLVDEPVSSLDPARADQLLDLLRRLSDEDGRTLVASLHSPELARRHFDRIIGLRHGRVVLDAPSTDIASPDLEHLYAITETFGSETSAGQGHEGPARSR